MLQRNDMGYDAASGMILGRRDRQEDAVAADFPVGTGHGFAVLADGMGGHEAGDMASRIVVTEMFSELKMQIGDPEALERNIRQVLCDATSGANSCIEHFARESGERGIMGATLLAPVLFGDRLYWISVGDSPLFLFRDGALMRLNEDHSMAHQIDLMQRQGLIGEAEAVNHPDRNCLTSVLIGNHIPRIDCSGRPVRLRHGDIVIAASDGLEFLSGARIAEIVEANRLRRSSEISSALLAEIEALDDPHQDNVSLCVIKAVALEAESAEVPAAPAARHEAPEAPSLTVLACKDNRGSLYCISRKVRA